MLGGNLSFSKDNLYKLEYSFNSIERVGTPGVTGEGAPNPTVKLKVDKNIVTNISYYFDPSRPGDDSPVIRVVILMLLILLILEHSQLISQFLVQRLLVVQIHCGSLLLNEPEGVADILKHLIATSSEESSWIYW